MNDLKKNKKQLISELNSLRKKLTVLEKNRQTESKPVTSRHVKSRELKQKLPIGNDHKNLLLENAGFSVGYYDLTGKILYFNTPALKNLKGELEDFIGKNVFDVFDEKAATLISNHLEEIAKQKKLAEYEDCIDLPIGRRCFLTRYVFIEGNSLQSPAIATISHDITKWKKMTKRLEQTQREKSLLLDSMNEMFAYYDFDLKIQWVNKASADSVNMTPDKMIGKHCYEIWHERNVPCNNCPVIKAMELKEPHESEQKTPDGRIWLLRGYPVFDDDHQITGLIEFGQDVTKRRKAEKALAREQYLMRTFMKYIPDSIYFKNQNGQFIRVNKAQAQRFKLDNPNAALGKTDFDFFTKEDAEELLYEDQQVIKTGIPFSKEQKKILLNGREGWISSIKIPLKNEHGKIIGLFGLTRDITQQKIAEKALTISEERLRKAQELAHLGNWDWDIKNKTLIWSDELYRIFGVEPDSFELTYDNIENCIHSEDKAQNQQMVDKLLNTEKSLEYTMRIVLPNGEIRHIKQHIEVKRDDAGNAINAFGTISDITDIKVVEEELRKEKETAQKYLDIAAVIFIVLDKAGNVLMINKKGFEVLGYPSESELIGVNWFEKCMTPQDGKKHFNVFRKMVSGEIELAEYYENTILGKENQKHIIAWHNSFIRDENDEIIGTLSSGEDITQRREAEHALQESRDRLQAILDNTTAFIYIKDMTGRFTLVNRQFKNTYEVNGQEIIGKTDYDILDPKYAKESQENDQKVITAGVPMQFEESVIANREKKTVISIKVPMYDTLKKIRGICCIATDITVLKKAQHEKENLEEQLQQSQKLEAIGRLASGVAHDFNNMLTAIIGNTDLLLIDISDKDLMLEDINEIKKAAERSSNLTQQLLAFSRKQPLKMDIVDLTSVIVEIDKMLQRLMGEDIQLSTQLSENLKRVKADRGQIEQVIINLAVNAKDAMPNGGNICIRTENVIVDKSIRTKINHINTNEFVCISFADNGPGMTEEVKSRIFEPFFSTKEKGKGTGLGLAVVYGIIRQHEGWIDVESGLGKGTIFKVYLPVFTTHLLKKRKKSSDMIKDCNGMGKRILLVEDEETVRKFAFRALVENGYKVSDTINSEQAIKIFKNEKGNFDLIFSDVVLPDQSGISLIEKLSKEGYRFQVLLSSGYTDEKSQWPLIRKRGYHFIQKPYTIQELLEKIKCIIAQ